MRSPTLLAAATALLAACGSTPTTATPARDAASDLGATDAAVATDTAPAEDLPTEPLTVSLFDATHLYFTGSDNQRTVDHDVQFPAARYARATLTITLACPSGRCDAWDRVAALSLLDRSAGDASAPLELEFARYVTPYGVGGTWTLDLTDLQPLFHGTRTVRAFIDTWVGPGNASGNGWLLTAAITFEPGAADHPVRTVIPLGWTNAVYGDPARPVAMQLAPRTVTVPAGVGGAKIWVSTTGHGQGNRENCAEFCARTHTVRFDDQSFDRSLWRDDCAQNPVRTQRGNWQPSRAGWCPGDVAAPWIVELPSAPTAGTHTVSYDVETYENSCRPGATPCTACVFNTGCPYNDSSHTEPFYRVAGYLLLTD